MLFNDLFYLQYHFHTHHIEYLPKCLERRIAHASLQILDCRDAYSRIIRIRRNTDSANQKYDFSYFLNSI